MINAFDGFHLFGSSKNIKFCLLGKKGGESIISILQNRIANSERKKVFL